MGPPQQPSNRANCAFHPLFPDDTVQQSRSWKGIHYRKRGHLTSKILVVVDTIFWCCYFANQKQTQTSLPALIYLSLSLYISPLVAVCTKCVYCVWYCLLFVVVEKAMAEGKHAVAVTPLPLMQIYCILMVQFSEAINGKSDIVV
jgi:hypothetical protein